MRDIGADNRKLNIVSAHSFLQFLCEEPRYSEKLARYIIRQFVKPAMVLDGDNERMTGNVLIHIKE